MGVRVATAADAEAIAALLTHLGYETDVEGLEQRLVALVRSPDDTVLVDERDGVVGVVVVSRTHSLIDPSLFGRITALCVSRHHQRRGVGEDLVRAAEAWLVARGVRLVQVNCGRRPEREAAHEFYPSLGYRDQHDHHVLYEKHLQ